MLVIASRTADVMWPTLQSSHPLLLISLSSISRYLVLVSDDLDALSYYGVGSMRLLISDPLFFLVGFWYGDKALAWMDQRSQTYGPMLRQGQKWFGKAAWPLVLIAPNNFICLFAGAAGMRLSVFFGLNVVGTMVRLYAIRVFGATFSSPIDSFQDFVREYQFWFLGASFLLVAYSIRGEFSGKGEISQLRELEEDLGGEVSSSNGESPDYP